jgi:gliding motility-associated-like protein
VQAFPKNAWGKRFLTATAAGNQTFNFFRVCVSDPTAVVLVNGAPIGVPLQNNFYYQIGPTNQPMKIEADKPITIAQYFTSQNRCGNGNPGDPEVIYLSPIEQNINKVLFNSNILVATGPQHFANVIIPNTGTAISSFRLDGAIPPTPFIVHPRDPNFSYIKISGLTQGQHTMQSDSGFNAIAYGFASAESYGYNAGTNVIDLYQFITTQNANATINAPVACKTSPFVFSLTLPYVPLSMKWEITGYPTVDVPAPVPDSTYMLNGRTLNLFRLPTPYVYNTIGNYPVKVTVNTPPNPEGCSGFQVINWVLQVFDPPTPDFTWPAVAASGCVDSIIPITTNNNGGGRPVIRHFWDFGDNTYAYTNNPSKTYSAPGEYTIRYAIMTDAGCLSDTLEKTIRVTNTPTAKFGFTAPQCQGKQITFSDTSNLTGNYGSLVNWNWNLGNTTIFNNSTNADVTTTYPATTTYIATLQVRTTTGCLSLPFALPVTVNPNPVPDFTNAYACLPDGVVNFTGTSTIADGTQNLFSYVWTFGDPASGPLNNDVIKDPSHKYPSVGPFDVKLKVTSNRGCIDSVTKSVANIYPQPKAGFSIPAEVCHRTQVAFNDASNGITHPLARWEWRFYNSANVQIGSASRRDTVFTFPSAGTYTIRHWAFTDQNCVSDTAERTIVINPLPTADNILSSPLCEKNQVTISDNSNPNVGTLVRWHWNLVGATVVNATNNNPVTYTYNNWGDKTIQLMVENSKGCNSDTITKVVRIHPLPKPGFILPEVCLRDAFAPFVDTSSIEDGTIGTVGYLWNFNAGNPPITPGPIPLTSTSVNNNIQFGNAGNYDITLRLQSAAGCVDSIRRTFTVNGVISRASFETLPTNGLCSNQDVEIKNTSLLNFGWLTKLEIYWDWTNNPTVVQLDDTPPVDGIYRHRYPNFQSPLTRDFQVRFVAYSGIICVDDTIHTIRVNASPLVQFDLMPGICVDAAPRQITQATETGGLPGSGAYTGPGVNATGLFDPAAAGVGTHTIRYTFTAANGCSDFRDQTIEVWARPVARLNVLAPTCEKNAIIFTSNGSLSNAANITTWAWNFGDGSLPVIVNNNNPVTHTYTDYGTYTTNLTVTNNRGCVSLPEPLQVKVNPLPRVNFTLPKVCLPAGTANFGDLSNIPDNTESQFKYFWDFGDGFANPPGSDTAIVKNPVYNYSSLGTYTVKLIVKSNNNCVDSISKQLVDVFPQPKARFDSKDSLCIGDVIDFVDNSDGIVRNITQWRWEFGDGRTSSVQNPGYLYRNPGTYTVRLFVYTSEGCISDTASKTIDVWAFPTLNAGPDITVLEDGIRRISDVRVTGSGLTFLWTPSTYLDNPTLQFPTIIQPKDDITYTITVTGRGGCVTNDDLFVKVLKMPKPPNTFTPNGDGFNDYWEIKYLNDYPQCLVEVYNTAGTLVYRSTGYSSPWDGTFKGQKLPVGTYYYVIDPKNGRAKQAGYVTIIR